MVVLKVVRFVNLGRNMTEHALKLHIEQRVKLTGKILQIFIRKHNDSLFNLIYAFVIFEKIEDALSTVSTLHDTIHEELKLCVEAIGPNEKYAVYNWHKKYQSDICNIKNALKRAHEYNELYQPKRLRLLEDNYRDDYKRNRNENYRQPWKRRPNFRRSRHWY